jgi:uncharacterized membrane protein YebE (DUF533 family)
MKLRATVLLVTLAGFAWQTPAHAIGCFSGGVAGAVAGHMAHHGVLGALGGCIAGHAYNKRQKRLDSQAESQRSYDPQSDRGTQQRGTIEN